VRFQGAILSFAAGVALGASGVIYGPELVAPYLPEAVQRKIPNLEGTVVVEKREGDRLLLTIQTQEGSILATFKKRVAETELLISEGDLITIVLRQYRPFVEDPVVARVRKQEPKQQRGDLAPSLPREEEQLPQSYKE
jgi:hypothetical protein